MELDLTKYTIEEVAELRDKCSQYIFFYKDGYEYICKVRSYGRFWRENISNSFALQELCYRYFGDDGIVDVYSTNPNLSHIENYGDVKYIKSVEDYEKWDNHNYLVRSISDLEKELEEWDNRDTVPFRERPVFGPIYSREDLANMKKELEEYDMSFVPPKDYK